MGRVCLRTGYAETQSVISSLRSVEIRADSVRSTSGISVEKGFLYPIRPVYEKFICSQSQFLIFHIGIALLSAELSCQLLARVSKQSEGQASFALSHHFYLPHGSQSERTRERERRKWAPHDSTVIGSIRKLFITVDSLHPSIDPLNCPKTTASHVTAALEMRKRVKHTHTHTAKRVRSISFNSI